ncbi:amidase [Microbacterium sp. RD1]|uniref:amidase n=1 Tax=Microbacterium sp. RD1 TaxID=3457313 RepID=UPI003FA5AE39
MSALHELSAVDLARMLRSREISVAEVAAHFLARIAAREDLGAFAEVTADAAMRRARVLDASEPSGALWGLPLADKDLVARAGVPTRYGSRSRAHHVPAASDPLAAALDDAGAVSLGKTATSEFGLTGYTEPLTGPPARDPWNPRNGAGGSSGGAAVAVAAGLLPFAPASDGGGSIRIPSATVGVVGLKPSRGRLPIGSGLDSPDGLSVAGPVARSVADAAFLLDALCALAPYPFAVGAADAPPFSPAGTADPPRLRIGATTVSPWDDDVDIVLDAGARAAFERAAATLGDLGHAVDDARWHPVGYGPLFRVLWRASAARLPLTEAELEQVEPITAWLVREGRALDAPRVLSALADARAFERATIAAFAPFDVVLTPALAMSPRPIGWYDTADAERAFEQQVQYAPHTSFVNVAGLPAISLPVSLDDTGHPVSVQLVGRPGGERRLLAIAAQLERASGPLPHPPVW